MWLLISVGSSASTGHSVSGFEAGADASVRTQRSLVSSVWQDLRKGAFWDGRGRGLEPSPGRFHPGIKSVSSSVTRFSSRWAESFGDNFRVGIIAVFVRLFTCVKSNTLWLL